LTLAAGAVVVAVVLVTTDDADRTAGRSATTTTSPAATPATTPEGYAFRAVQQGSGDPVAWDPCRPIAVVVAGADATPDGAVGLLEEALAEVGAATGFEIEVEGRTDEPPAVERELVQPARYGDRWAPVLVAWTDPEAVPALEGDVGGLGGSTAVAAPAGTEVYVSGTLLLDGPQMRESLRVVGGRDQVRSVLLHELGHVVGLAHVDDPEQLMYPEGQPGASGYAAGDRAGLARLGEGPCAPDLRPEVPQ